MCAQLRASDVSGVGKRKGGSFISGFSDEGQGKDRGASFQHPYLHSAVPTTPETGDLRKTPQLCISSCICSEERQGGGDQHQSGSASLTLSYAGPLRPGLQGQALLPQATHTVPTRSCTASREHSPHPAWCRGAHTPRGQTLHKPPRIFLAKSRISVVSVSTGEQWA